MDTAPRGRVVCSRVGEGDAPGLKTQIEKNYHCKWLSVIAGDKTNKFKNSLKMQKMGEISKGKMILVTVHFHSLLPNQVPGFYQQTFNDVR